MEDVHQSQRYGALCKHLFGPDSGSVPLPDMVAHIEQAMDDTRMINGDILAENQLLKNALQEMQVRLDALDEEEATAEDDFSLAAENQLLRNQLQDLQTHLEALHEQEALSLSQDDARALIEAGNQQLRAALEDAQRIPADAPAQHELNDCAMALLNQLDEGITDWALEVCAQDSVQPWQMVAGHLQLSQERGELSSPILDPGWTDRGKVENLYTCGGCGKTEPGRRGQLFCSNACAKLVQDRECAAEPSPEGLPQPERTRSPIRRRGAIV